MDLLDILIFLFKYKSDITACMFYYNMFNYTCWTIQTGAKVPYYVYKKLKSKPEQIESEGWEILNSEEPSEI
jgi:hypothetical protein